MGPMFEQILRLNEAAAAVFDSFIAHVDAVRLRLESARQLEKQHPAR
jgi:hypothetical protein